jgi:hypothetical protein
VSRTRPVPLPALRFAEMERRGRSFSSASSPTLLQRSGTRSRTPSSCASGLRSILTGTSVPLAPQRSRPCICFDVLERFLAGRPIGRIVGADALKFGGWQRLNAEYAKQFGVEPPGGSDGRI